MTQEGRTNKMETDILLSLKRPFSRKILSGEKEWVLRKTEPLGEPVKIWLYESGKEGTRAIIGWCQLRHSLFVGHSSLHSLLNWLPEKACVTEDYLRNYLPGYAWKVQDPLQIPYPVPLSTIGIRRPPQSWQYLSQSQVKVLKKALKKALKRPDCSTCANNGELDYYFCDNCARSPYLIDNYIPIEEV